MIDPPRRLLFRAEATERLVGSTVFKTVEAVKAAWRVRFPSASAIAQLCWAPRGVGSVPSKGGAFVVVRYPVPSRCHKPISRPHPGSADSSVLGSLSGWLFACSRNVFPSGSRECFSSKHLLVEAFRAPLFAVPKGLEH